MLELYQLPKVHLWRRIIIASPNQKLKWGAAYRIHVTGKGYLRTGEHVPADKLGVLVPNGFELQLGELIENNSH